VPNQNEKTLSSRSTLNQIGNIQERDKLIGKPNLMTID